MGELSERERVAEAIRKVWAAAWGDSRETSSPLLAALADAALGALDLDQIRAEVREQSDRLLAEVASHMAIGHRHAGYAHDHLGANLGCAGCALLARIEQHLEPTETGEPT
jgi:hypothetical protein